MPALPGKVALVIGNGTAEHRAVAVALAESGASSPLPATPDRTGAAALDCERDLGDRPKVDRRRRHGADDAASFAAVAGKAQAELGGLDLVVRVEAVAAV